MGLFLSSQWPLRELGLGSAQIVSLAAAREKAKAAREALASGADPKLASKKLDAPTFGDCADAFIKTMQPSWRNAKHGAQWRMTLEIYAGPIRSTPIADVATADILKILSPIWSTKPETASRLRGRLEAVLDAAKAQGLRSGDNPAVWRGHLAAILPKARQAGSGHHAAMAIDDLPGFMVRLRDQTGTSARALEFAILTAARSGEVLGAKWDEIGDSLWTVPAVRMKGGRQHRVPLSAAAAAVLEQQRAHRTCDFIFPGVKAGCPLSKMTLALVLRRMKVDVTAHGFRSTFKDWASERTAFPGELSEMALAHSVGDKTEAAYRRGDLFQKRVELMVSWESHCIEER